MDELIPIILGVILGTVIGASTSGRARFALSICAVLVSGLAATVLSGEYLESWLYLLLDLGEAAFGLALGLVIALRLRRRRFALHSQRATRTRGRL